MVLDVGSFLDLVVGCWERETNLLVFNQSAGFQLFCEVGNKDDSWAFGLGDFMNSFITYQNREYVLYFSPSTQTKPVNYRCNGLRSVLISYKNKRIALHCPIFHVFWSVSPLGNTDCKVQSIAVDLSMTDKIVALRHKTTSNYSRWWHIKIVRIIERKRNRLAISFNLYFFASNSLNQSCKS